jgi:transposase
MLVGVRDRLIRNRTQLANAIRGHAAEFGLTAAKGMAKRTKFLSNRCCAELEADRAMKVDVSCEGIAQHDASPGQGCAISRNMARSTLA